MEIEDREEKRETGKTRETQDEGVDRGDMGYREY